MQSAGGSREDGGRERGREENVDDRGNGIYLCSYGTTSAGPARLDLLCNGWALPGSPFEVNVAPGPICYSACTASGPGLRQAVRAGGEAAFTIVARDRFGNRCSGGGGRFGARVETRPVGAALARWQADQECLQATAAAGAERVVADAAASAERAAAFRGQWAEREEIRLEALTVVPELEGVVESRRADVAAQEAANAAAANAAAAAAGNLKVKCEAAKEAGESQNEKIRFIRQQLQEARSARENANQEAVERAAQVAAQEAAREA